MGFCGETWGAKVIEEENVGYAGLENPKVRLNQDSCVYSLDVLMYCVRRFNNTYCCRWIISWLCPSWLPVGSSERAEVNVSPIHLLYPQPESPGIWVRKGCRKLSGRHGPWQTLTGQGTPMESIKLYLSEKVLLSTDHTRETLVWK